MQAQPVHRQGLIAGRSSRIVRLPARDDAIDDLGHHGIRFFGGDDGFRYFCAQIIPRQRCRHQEHAPAALCCSALDDLIPVETRVSGDEVGHVASPFDVPPQFLAAMDGQNNESIFGREGEQVPPANLHWRRSAPQSVIIDIQRHLHGRQARMRFDGSRIRFEKYLLALDAVNEVELRRGQPAGAGIAAAMQEFDGLRQIAVANKQVQIAKFSQAQVAEDLHRQDRAFESKGLHSGIGKSLHQPKQLLQEQLIPGARLLNQHLKSGGDITGHLVVHKFGQGVSRQPRQTVIERLARKLRPVDAAIQHPPDGRFILRSGMCPGASQKEPQLWCFWSAHRGKTSHNWTALPSHASSLA
ncbi:MAG TPA: hypothetical protein VEV64_10810 [Rhizomicrobium sp.]|nr:hypothetical protein [Rhizomicrobium sp.]